LHCLIADGSLKEQYITGEFRDLEKSVFRAREAEFSLFASDILAVIFVLSPICYLASIS
jgi:hypothetical protein